jgi:hypothetical protein
LPQLLQVQTVVDSVYTLTPSFAIFAASTYLSGIAGELHPPASCNLPNGVPFRAARVAELWRRSRGSISMGR